MHIDPNKMVTIKIDGIPVTVPSGTTIMEAAKKIGIKIPSLCHHPDLGVRAYCRVRLQQLGGRSGRYYHKLPEGTKSASDRAGADSGKSPAGLPAL